MAVRKFDTKNGPEWRRGSDDHGLSSEARHVLRVIFLCIIGVLSVLAFFGAAGALGHWWRLFLATFFGRIDLLVPIVVCMIVLSQFFPARVTVLRSQWWGVVLLLVSLVGLFHLRIPETEGLAVIGEERGGGYLGLLVSYPLRAFAGTWGGTSNSLWRGNGGSCTPFQNDSQQRRIARETSTNDDGVDEGYRL